MQKIRVVVQPFDSHVLDRREVEGDHLVKVVPPVAAVPRLERRDDFFTLRVVDPLAPDVAVADGDWVGESAAVTKAFEVA